MDLNGIYYIIFKDQEFKWIFHPIFFKPTMYGICVNSVYFFFNLPLSKHSEAIDF
jgi:hypothetical protein